MGEREWANITAWWSLPVVRLKAEGMGNGSWGQERPLTSTGSNVVVVSSLVAITQLSVIDLDVGDWRRIRYYGASHRCSMFQAIGQKTQYLGVGYLCKGVVSESGTYGEPPYRYCSVIGILDRCWSDTTLCGGEVIMEELESRTRLS